jgi:hypothetical protein
MKHLSTILLTGAIWGCGGAREPVLLGQVGNLAVVAGYAFSPTATEAAAYLTLRNLGPVEDTLVSITSPIAASVMLHDSRQNGESVQMIALDRLVMPGGLAVEMAPGGMHLMLSGLIATLSPGKTLPLRLTFAQAGLLEVSIPINRYGDTP